MSFELRDYQLEGVESLRASYRAGKRAPLYVLPTGGGKTAVFAHIGKSSLERGRRVVILVHRQELLSQASRALSRLGVDHGVIAPGYPESPHLIQVASVQTAVRRTARVSPPGLIVIDEAHHAVSKSYRGILEAFPDAAVLGVTATPCRTDGDGLGKLSGGVFDDLIIGPSVEELIRRGFLVQPEVYAPPTGIDLTGVHRRMGDYDKKELSERVDKPKITGSAVEHYKTICSGAPAIAFCVSVAHARSVAAEFARAGINAAHVDGSMEDQPRRAALRGLEDGSIGILTSADLIGEGVDIPRVTAAILLRPTQSLSLYLQQVGRALRPYPGKQRAIILDHVGNTLRHGFPDDPRDWCLDPEDKGSIGGRSSPQDLPAVKISQCETCYFVFETGPACCPQCGRENPVKLRKIEEVEGELKRISREQIEAARRSAAAAKRMEEGRAQSLAELQAIERARGYSKGWAWNRWNARQRKRA